MTPPRCPARTQAVGHHVDLLNCARGCCPPLPSRLASWSMRRWLAHALLLLLITGVTSARFIHEIAAHGSDGCSAGHRHAESCLNHGARERTTTSAVDGQTMPALPERPCRDRASCRTCELLAISIAGAPGDTTVVQPIGDLVDGTRVEHERIHAVRTASVLRARPPPLS